MAEMLKPGTRIGTYTICQHVGGGGEAQVYEAKDGHGNKVALRHILILPGAAGSETKARADRCKALIGQKCPHVACLLDSFQEAGEYYEVYEYVEGVTLREHLDRHGRLPEEQLISVARDLLTGLDWLHSVLHIVHRDIKPENIMVFMDDSGCLRAKIIDLGVIVFTDRARLTVKTAPCTAAYAAPEMFLGKDYPISGVADLHSLGLVLSEAATGEMHFTSLSLAQLVRDQCDPSTRRRISSVNPSISREMDDFVFTLIQAHPEDRFSSAKEALKALPGSGASSPPAKPKRLGLRIVDGPKAGKVIFLAAKGTPLGRAAINEEDRRISRFHVLATPCGSRVRLKDLESTNRLVYKGKRRRKVMLPVSERVVLGSTTLECCEL